jgi:homoserine kinase
MRIMPLPDNGVVAPSAQRIDTGQDIEVSVPATSANLGPGFDSLGLAVALFDRVRVRTVPSGTTIVAPTGEGSAALPTDAGHLVARTLLDTLRHAGWSSPGLEVETVNAIPHGRGLGSSAAAIVSGALAANALLPEEGRLDDAALLQWCSALEGHPDNAAPALMGSLAVSWETDGTYSSARLEVHPDVIPIAAVPDTALSTESARALLPVSVAHGLAAANAGRAALLVHALMNRPRPPLSRNAGRPPPGAACQRHGPECRAPQGNALEGLRVGHLRCRTHGDDAGGRRGAGGGNNSQTQGVDCGRRHARLVAHSSARCGT